MSSCCLRCGVTPLTSHTEIGKIVLVGDLGVDCQRIALNLAPLGHELVRDGRHTKPNWWRSHAQARKVYAMRAWKCCAPRVRQIGFVSRSVSSVHVCGVSLDTSSVQEKKKHNYASARSQTQRTAALPQLRKPRDVPRHRRSTKEQANARRSRRRASTTTGVSKPVQPVCVTTVVLNGL